MDLRLVLGGLGALALVGSGYALGHRSARLEAQGEAWQAEALLNRRAIDRIERATAATQLIAEASAARAAQIRTFTTTLVREVPVHVDAETDARFPMPVGLVRVHDAAALGRPVSAIPDPAGRPDGEASDVVASTLASVVALNYGTCREDQTRLSAWQAWATAQASVDPGVR
jgi:hypothetical protein